MERKDQRLVEIMKRYNSGKKELFVNGVHDVRIPPSHVEEFINSVLRHYDMKFPLTYIAYTLLAPVVDVSMYKKGHTVDGREEWSVPSPAPASAAAAAGAKGGKRTSKQRRKSKKHRKTRHRR